MTPEERERVFSVGYEVGVNETLELIAQLYREGILLDDWKNPRDWGMRDRYGVQRFTYEHVERIRNLVVDRMTLLGKIGRGPADPLQRHRDERRRELNRMWAARLLPAVDWREESDRKARDRMGWWVRWFGGRDYE